MKKRIHVFGPTYIDKTIRLKDSISLDGSARIEEERVDPGGTGLCYAIALSRIGNPVTLHSRIGKDDYANEIRRAISSEHNLTPYWQVGSGTTDHAYILIDNGNHKTVASHKNSSKKWNAKKTKFQSIDSKAMVITSFPNQIVNDILNEIRKLSKKPFILWAPHRSNCTESESLSSLLKLVDHITLSEEEFGLLHSKIGLPTKYGVKSITITSGKNGCRLLTKDGFKSFSAFRAVNNPYDTNGAGEAFGSGFLTTYLDTYDFETSIRAGSILGYLHVHRHASDFPRLDKVQLIKMSKGFFQDNQYFLINQSIQLT